MGEGTSGSVFVSDKGRKVLSLWDGYRSQLRATVYFEDWGLGIEGVEVDRGIMQPLGIVIRQREGMHGGEGPPAGGIY